jgi:carboxyl-terminal processing protease
MNDPRLRLPFPPFLILLGVFSAGVLTERAGWIPGRVGSQPETLRETFKPFWEAWDKVQFHFVDRDRVKDDLLMQGALAGMIQSLGDHGHTSYLSKEQCDKLKDGLAGKLEGIGARVGFLRQQSAPPPIPRSTTRFRWRKSTRARAVSLPTIVQTMPQSPARSAGVRAGDVLVAVDGAEVRGLRLGQIVNKVRGTAGTEVRLRLNRPGQSKSVEVAVKRASVDVPDVTWQLLPGSKPIAHVCFQRFSKNSGKLFRSVLEQAKAKSAVGVILDLRGNPGGLKEQAVVAASELLAEGKVVFVQQDAKAVKEEVLSRGQGRWLDRPVVVLIDGGSASSSEILAGALQDNARAKLVGTRSYGTGTVLREYPLSDGSAVLLAVSLWLTPKGRQIRNQGITPDVVVSLPAGAGVLLPDDQTPLTAERFAATDDVQLRKAYELVIKETR